MLEIRQELGKTSTKKYDAIEAAVDKIRRRLAERVGRAADDPGLFRFDLDKGAKSKYVEDAVDYIRHNYAERITINSCAATLPVPTNVSLPSCCPNPAN